MESTSHPVKLIGSFNRLLVQPFAVGVCFGSLVCCSHVSDCFFYLSGGLAVLQGGNGKIGNVNAIFLFVLVLYPHASKLFKDAVFTFRCLRCIVRVPEQVTIGNFGSGYRYL